MRNNKQLAGIFCAAFLLYLGTQIPSSILGELRLSFPEESVTRIQMVYTLVSLGSFVMNLVVGVFIRRKKATLLAGIALWTVAGLMGGLCTNLNLLLVSRILSGAGTGIMTPTINSIISDITEKDVTTKALSISSMMTQFGSLLASVLAGALAIVNWRLAFGLYALGIIPFVLVAKHVPEIKVERKASEPISLKTVPGMVWLMALVFFVYFGIFNSVFTNLSIYCTELGISTGLAGLAISMCATGAMLFSPAVPYFGKLFGRFCLPVSFVLVGLTFMGLSRATTALSIGVLLFVMGLISIASSVLITSAAMYVSNKDNSTLCAAIVTCGSTVGSLVCPYVCSFTASVFSNDSIPFCFMANGWQLMGLAAVLFLYFGVKKDAWHI